MIERIQRRLADLGEIAGSQQSVCEIVEGLKPAVDELGRARLRPRSSQDARPIFLPPTHAQFHLPIQPPQQNA
ncbi:hypothetical protein ASE17_02295 [Phenylobacterium sp. Root77]|nr:hypothetical protein ASC73_06520 [Phenylobacterium sp. Root1277]KQW94658.1 hypothetical protein ASC79_02665 [Phenylobacterium sp. Root1290]KRC44351.1 hypothetical protein ASE17_02295 [Phenylobacterium sp. Root77]